MSFQVRSMSAVDIIRKKRDGGTLTVAEMQEFIKAVTNGSWPEYQTSALLMAIFFRGMTTEETLILTRTMVESGKTLDLSSLPGTKVDKHSTGGVGDKVSLVLAPLAAACGVVVPMMSGRGLGHTGGTLDKLESIPGFKVNLKEADFIAALKNVGCAMMGQTKDVAPADKKLYGLRDVTATVECMPLITASILSKKIAEGISALVMDVKCGSGSFMKKPRQARQLAETIQAVGKANGLNIRTLITNMEAPLGRMVGNSLEVIEAMNTLKGSGPADLTELCLLQARMMVQLAGIETSETKAERLVKRVLKSGEALDKFRAMVKQQGGDPRIVEDPTRLPVAKHLAKVTANTEGYVTEQDAYTVGQAAMKLGAGRETADQKIDPAVGVVICKKAGEKVKPGDTVYEIHHQGGGVATTATTMLAMSFRIGSQPPKLDPLVLEILA
jgi:pyrimidine-nucleoside phosphorylase